MNNIVLDFSLTKQLTAGPKAREDVNRTLSNHGYKIIKLTFSKASPIKTIFSLLSIIYRIPFNSNVIVQYPIGTISGSYVVLLLLKLKCCKTTILIHDIESLRLQQSINRLEKSCLKFGKVIIAHTPNMKNILTQFINSNKIRILNIFDYYVDKLPNKTTEFNNTIAFAGNLSKSCFLKKLKYTNLKFNIYGSYNDNLSEFTSEKIIYKGFFQQEDLSNLEADWGLVWDGNDIKTCNGNMGEYLKYNAPHKLSLYIAAQIPVIVWEQSAEKDFVINNVLGISIDSLENLNNILQTITEEQYKTIKTNIRVYSQRIRSGNLLKSTLDIK